MGSAARRRTDCGGPNAMRADVSASPHCVDPVAPGPGRARLPFRRFRGREATTGRCLPILRDERRNSSKGAFASDPVRTRSKPKLLRGPRSPSSPKRVRFPSGPLGLPKQPSTFRFGSPSGPKPGRFTVWWFREARKPLVPPGCSTKLATLPMLGEARSTPLGGGFVSRPRLRLPIVLLAKSPVHLGCGVRRCRSGELRRLGHEWKFSRAGESRKGIPLVDNEDNGCNSGLPLSPSGRLVPVPRPRPVSQETALLPRGLPHKGSPKCKQALRPAGLWRILEGNSRR